MIVAAIYAGLFCKTFGNLEHWPGSPSYVRLSENILQGKGYSLDGVYPTALRPPLYPLILAFTMRLTGKHWFAATVLLQSIAAALCLLMVFKIARAFWPQTSEPMLGAGLLALHGPFMFEMLSLRETVWFTLALLGVAWLLVSHRKGAASAMALGFYLASLYLLRPTGVMIVGVTAAFLAWNIVCQREGARRSFLVICATGLMLVAPWQIFTCQNFGAPGFFPASSNGFNLAKGTDPELFDVSPWIDADSLDPSLQELVWTVPWQDERAKDKVWTTTAIARVLHAPKRMLYCMASNAVEFLSPLPIPLGTGQFRSTSGGITIENFRLNWAELAFAPVVLMLLFSGCSGLKSFLKGGGTRKSLGLWIAIVFLTFLAAHAATFAKTRYRLPLDALLAISAGGWLASLGRRVGIDPCN